MACIRYLVSKRFYFFLAVLHADCEAVLLEDDSKQNDIWGADWLPDSKEVRFEALINIRPKQNNRSMVIENDTIRRKVEKIVRERLEI